MKSFQRRLQNVLDVKEIHQKEELWNEKFDENDHKIKISKETRKTLMMVEDFDFITWKTELFHTFLNRQPFDHSLQ